MSQKLDDMIALIREGNSRIEAEQKQTRSAIAELKDKIEELETRPEQDYEAAMVELKEMVESIDEIYEPEPEDEQAIEEAVAESQPAEAEPTEGEPASEPSELSEEEKQEIMQTTKSATDVPEPDVIVSIPEHMTIPPDAPEGFKFADPV